MAALPIGEIRMTAPGADTDQLLDAASHGDTQARGRLLEQYTMFRRGI